MCVYSVVVLLFCLFCFVLRESHCVSLAGLEFRDLPDSVFQVLELKKGICHHTQQTNCLLKIDLKKRDKRISSFLNPGILLEEMA